MIRVRYRIDDSTDLHLVLLPERNRVLSYVLGVRDIRLWRGCARWDWLVDGARASGPAGYDLEPLRGRHLESVAAAMEFDDLRTIASGREVRFRICATQAQLDAEQLRTLRLALRQADAVGVVESDDASDPLQDWPSSVRLL